MITQLHFQSCKTFPLVLNLIAGALTVTNGCAPAKFVPPQSEIEQFEHTPGLSDSEIPKVYDESRLQIGSKATRKYVRGSFPPYLQQQILKSIESKDVGKKYIVERTSIDKRGKYTETLETDAFSLSWIMIPNPNRDKIISASYSDRDTTIDWAKVLGEWALFGVFAGLFEFADQDRSGFDIPDDEVAQP